MRKKVHDGAAEQSASGAGESEGSLRKGAVCDARAVHKHGAQATWRTNKSPGLTKVAWLRWNRLRACMADGRCCRQRRYR
eukprot:1369737-Prymnesium_polylepis.2